MDTPSLRFKEFNSAGSNWAQFRVGQIALKVQDGNYGVFYPKPEEFLHKGIPFLTAKVLGKNGGINFSKIDFISSEKHAQLKKGHIYPRDILFTNRGASFGSVAIVPNTLIEGNIGPQLTLIRADFSKLVPEFLLHKFTTPDSKNLIQKLDSGSAMNFVGIETTKNIKVKIPHIVEQQKIADFLTSVDEKINLLKKKKELLEQYKKGVMQKIFSQELRFKDEQGKDFPEWEEKRLGDICEITKGKQLNVENMVEDGLFPALNGGITYSGYTNSWNTEKDTITVSEGGNSCGFVSFIKEDFWCGGHCYALKNIKEGVIKIYLYQNLKQHELSIMRMRVGSGLPNIQKKALADFYVKVPDPKEQQKIADFLTAVDDKIALFEQQINKTELWKKGLLQQMFV